MGGTELMAACISAVASADDTFPFHFEDRFISWSARAWGDLDIYQRLYVPVVIDGFQSFGTELEWSSRSSNIDNYYQKADSDDDWASDTYDLW